MDAKTTLKQIAEGSRFRLPGKSATFTKGVADSFNRTRIMVQNPRGTWLGMDAETEIVPEHGATVSDILGSWRQL